MRVQADRAVCVGAGMCVLTAPEVFDQDEEDGRVVLVDPERHDPELPTTEPSDDLREAVAEAVELCPSGAITRTEEDSSVREP